jgi:hypothetical protein
MPYIKIDRQCYIDKELSALIGKLQRMKPEEGDLNYVIQKLLLLTKPPKNYKDFNALVGILECAKLEFYRRMVVPYEESKFEENGDIF